MRPKRATCVACLLIMAALIALPMAGTGAAEEGAVADLGVPEIRISGADYAFEGVPDTIDAGLTMFTLENTGADIHHAQLLRLNEDVTYEEVLATLPETSEEFGDPAFLEHLIAKLTFVGGIGIIPPGFTSSVILDLEPGVYVLFCGLDTPDGSMHSAEGMIASFEVVAPEAASDAVPPEADVTIDMADFSYSGLEEPLAAGTHIMEIVNTGVEPHEMLLFQLAPGATVEEALMSLEAPQDGLPPAIPAGGMQVLPPGDTGWLVTDLQPGTYLVICFVPSFANEGQPHIALGMMAAFEVAAT